MQVGHLSGIQTDSVGIFMQSDLTKSATLDVGDNLVFEQDDNANGEQILFHAINNGDSLRITVGEEFSFRHSASDSTQLYDIPNIDFQSVDFTVGGNLFLFNDNFNSPQPFNAVFNNSRVIADVFELNALENTDGQFQVNFAGYTDVDIKFYFKRSGNGGKIKFSDQSTLRYDGSGYQEITGFGELQDSIIYNNVVVDIAEDPSSDRQIPELVLLKSYGELVSKVMIEGQLTLNQGILVADYDIFSAGFEEVVFGQDAAVVGAKGVSYINGVVSKIGNTPFIFPVGHDDGPRQISVLDNNEFQKSDLIRVNPLDNFCGLTDSLLIKSALIRDRTKEYWEVTALLSDNNVAATFEPIVSDKVAEGITDFTSLELIDFFDGSSLGNGFNTDTSFQSAMEYDFSVADTARLGLSSNLESENPFYYQRKILSLTESFASAGENITLNLSGPFASPADQVVIGGKIANVVSNTDNSLTVRVPDGARSGNIEVVYNGDQILYGSDQFTVSYDNTIGLEASNYENKTILDSINGTVLLGQSKMELGQINNDSDFDAMIVSSNYEAVTVISSLSGATTSHEFFLNSEGLTLKPTDFKLQISNIGGTLGVDALFDVEYNGVEGIIYFKNDGNGNFTPVGDGNFDDQSIYNDYLLVDSDFDGITDALFSVFDLSSSSSILSGEGGGFSDCSPYAKTILPFIEPNNREFNQILKGNYLENGNADISYLNANESLIGLIDLFNHDTTIYTSNPRSSDQIFEIKNISLLNNGFDQIVASNQNTDEIEIFTFNNGTETFDITTIPLEFTPAKLVVEDLNGDGFQDLIVSDQNSPSLNFLLNDGAGQLTVELTVSYDGGIIADFDILDLNNDGFKDFLILQEGGELSISYFEVPAVAGPPIISATNITNSGFNLEWDSVANASEYEIFISMENDTVPLHSSDSTFLISDTSLTFSAPEPFQTYYVFGRSINLAGDSSFYSNSVEVQLLPIEIPTPVSSNPTSNLFDLTWPIVPGADEYQVYIGINNDTSSIAQNDSLFVVPSDSITFHAPEYSELYYFYVRAISNTGDTSAFSIQDSIKLPVSTYLEQDSLAMLAFYESTNGENWNNAQNWTTGKLNTWEGLSMIQDSLFSINLPGNQMEGVLPNELGNLNFVNEINLSQNNITDITALEALVGSLNNLDVSGNELSFDQLETFVTVPNFAYENQNFAYNLPPEFFDFLGANMSIEIEAPASSNTFQWYKDSVQIAGETNSTLVLNDVQRLDEGIYYVEVNNDLLGELSLSSAPTELKVSTLERDVEALRVFYDSTNGEGWTSIDWDTAAADPTTWSDNGQDIIVEDNRVVEINLPENNLTGSVPDAINDILGLRTLNISGNALESLADLTSLPNLELIDVTNNSLDYSDLEPNITIDGISFANQAKFGNEADQKLPQGAELSISYSVGGTNNTYQWFRNGVEINISDSSSISIDSLTYSAMGEYVLEVRNDLINSIDPEFKLISNPVQVIATANISGQISDANKFPTEAGQVYLFEYQEGAEYDSVRLGNGDFFVNADVGGVFEMQDVELGDYVLYVDNDDQEYPDLLNTYFTNTIDWEFANIIYHRSNIEGLEVTMEGEPEPLNGTSNFSGFLEEEFEEGERKLPRRRVSGVGVSVRVVTGSSRDLSFRSILENGQLVAYLETDENGEFVIPNLPAGRYSVKFDIPGVPMNEESDIIFDLTGENKESLEISAISDNGKITVSRVSYTANQSSFEKSVVIYPNPSNGIFRIKGVEEISTIKIIGPDGRLIEEISDFGHLYNELEIDLSNYPDGMYFMQIEWGDGLRSMNKMIKE
ncbi:T9SS type A sorting domain-containing protein [Marivirga harenae]|uniref:T9SS type A sorting domain-containing protein n=1 Tax=Marivirga harenae TaxID=2010992 RepID=UPI0026E0CB1C|nr:T9SS type A sorting domain-containing protein [Marivirga harenae]WKV10757.1 T9SS type A sorting domain-containing protein [Marivirga harenae]